MPGDGNLDGKVDSADLSIVIGNYGRFSAGLSPQVVATQDSVLPSNNTIKTTSVASRPSSIAPRAKAGSSTTNSAAALTLGDH